MRFWLDNNQLILADSSFYICFLDDIDRPDALSQILERFNFIITPLVFEEISKRSKPASQTIIGGNHIVRVRPNFNFQEILRPFFSNNEVDSGEAELIALAYIWHESRRIQRLILDDSHARRFVTNNLAQLNVIMIGTVGFVGECHCNFSVFDKSSALMYLREIKASKFFIEEHVIALTKERIVKC